MFRALQPRIVKIAPILAQVPAGVPVMLGHGVLRLLRRDQIDADGRFLVLSGFRA